MKKIIFIFVLMLYNTFLCFAVQTETELFMPVFDEVRGDWGGFLGNVIGVRYREPYSQGLYSRWSLNARLENFTKGCILEVERDLIFNQREFDGFYSLIGGGYYYDMRVMSGGFFSKIGVGYRDIGQEELGGTIFLGLQSNFSGYLVGRETYALVFEFGLDAMDLYLDYLLESHVKKKKIEKKSTLVITVFDFLATLASIHSFFTWILR